MQDRIEKIVSNIVTGSGATHAYIIEGTNISVRDAFLNSFIKGILCENSESTGRACNRCRMCKQVDAGTSLDYIKMRRSGKVGYKVKDAEDFISRLGMGSYGRKLVGLIDNAELLGEVIENKLLKTLEEPPADTIILLSTSNADNLLKTVRSRCSLIREADYSSNFSEDFSCENSAFSNDEDKEEPKLSYDDFKTKSFYEFRTAVSKKLKSNEDALTLLGLMEDEYRNNMLDTGNTSFFVEAIERISKTRVDICLGMSYDKALKRLYLELFG